MITVHCKVVLWYMYEPPIKNIEHSKIMSEEKKNVQPEQLRAKSVPVSLLQTGDQKRQSPALTPQVSKIDNITKRNTLPQNQTQNIVPLAQSTIRAESIQDLKSKGQTNSFESNVYEKVQSRKKKGLMQILRSKLSKNEKPKKLTKGGFLKPNTISESLIYVDRKSNKEYKLSGISIL